MFNVTGSMKSLVFLLIASVVLFLQIRSTHAEPLPPANLDEPTISCLQNADWVCALELLIPQFYEEGTDTNLQYYIAYSYVNRARDALREKDYSQATEHLGQALLYDDANPVIYGELGMVFYQLSRYDEAENNFLSARQLDQNNHHYPEMLGQLHYLKGNLDEASAYWQQALDIFPDNDELRKRLNQIHEQSLTEQQGTTELSHIFRITFDQGMDKEIYSDIWKILEDSWYQIGLQLQLYPKRQIPVLLLTREKYQSITNAPEWSGGVYEGQIKIPVANFSPELHREVITHEYTHALLYDTMANRCPWWLNEGFAQYFSMDKHSKQQSLQFARQYLNKNSVVDLKKIPGKLHSSEEARLAYALGLSATDFLIERFSIITARNILTDMANGMNFPEGFEKNTGWSFSEFLTMWNNNQ